MAARPDRGHLDKARRLAEQVADVASPTIDSAAKTAKRAGGAAGKTARRTGEAAVDHTKSAAATAREAVDGGVRTVTLHEFRDEVSALLADMTQVLVVLDARVRRIETHLGLVDDEPPVHE